MSMMVSFVLSFFPRDVLDEILNLIESVSEDFPSYSNVHAFYIQTNHDDIREKYKIFHLPCEILLRVVILFNSVQFKAGRYHFYVTNVKTNTTLRQRAEMLIFFIVMLNK